MNTIATYSRKLKDSSGNFVAPATRASCVYMNDDTTLEDFVNNLDLRVTGIYPVGSIYQSTDSTSPASLFGGSWEQIQNMFLLGSGSRGVGTTGGEESHVLTVNEMPSHTHGGIYWFSPNINVQGGGADSDFHALKTSDRSYSTYAAGEDQAHNNMPPYVVVNIWRRTA